MKTDKAITKSWEALVEVEHYFKDGISQQLATAVTFSGEDAKPIRKAQLTLKQCEPFLPPDVKEISRKILLTAFEQFNLFLDSLKKIVASGDDLDKKKAATKEANKQLQKSLEAYRDKLSDLRKVIPHDIGKDITQNISISGPVNGQLNIAGESIIEPSMNITLAELKKRIDESNHERKNEAKSKLNSLLKHPLVVEILGAASGGIFG